jgi:PAS domain S-box-containing protein
LLPRTFTIPRSAAARYTVAAASVLIAVAFQFAFRGVLAERPFFSFFPAILITAAVSGFGPAVMAIGLSSFFLELHAPLPGVQLAVFDGFTLVISLLLATYRREMLRLRGEHVQNLQLLANAAPAMAWVTNARGEATFLNDRWLHFTGRALEQELGDGWTDSVHPDDVAVTLAHYREAFDVRAPFRLEFRLRAASGEYRWMSSYGVPRYHADGTFDGYLGSVVDIDDMKRLDTGMRELTRTLAEERERLQTIISSVPGVVWEAWGRPDRGTQRIDFISAHVSRMLGYSVDEWLSTPNFWLSIVHPDDREQAAQQAAEHWATGVDKTNAFRWLTRDGHAIDVESHSTVVYDENGQPVGMRGVTLDVTARKRAEESLRFLSRVSELLAGSLDVQATLDTAARLALPLLGDLCMIDLVEDETIRRVSVRHIDPDKQPIADRLLAFPPDPRARHGSAEAIRTLQPQYGDSIGTELLSTLQLSPAHRAAAEALGVESYMIVPLEARGHAVGAIHFSSPIQAHYTAADHDLAQLFARRVALAIDNAQLYQAALEASRARDQFLATVSHELRTPMTATLGWVRMLSLGALDADTRTVALDAIERSTRAQARLIEDILDVSSIVTGKFRLEVGPVDLPSVLDNAIAALRPAAEAKQIALEIDDAGWCGFLNGDTNRLQQVIWNLVSNAIKFGRRGGRIDVRLQRVEGLARLTVSDDGAGIEREFLPHVFERFRQADATLTRTHGGLGLGLAIVRHLVELHGGTARAESEGAGHGATFTVELPLVTQQTTTNSAVPHSLPRLDDKRVLVVDDENDARTMVSAVLRGCGATVTTVGSAAEAMAADERERHDLLITDIAMPGEDGFSLAHRLRISGGPAKAIALSALADLADHPQAAEFTAILRKPVDPIDLARAVAITLR